MDGLGKVHHAGPVEVRQCSSFQCVTFLFPTFPFLLGLGDDLFQPGFGIVHLIGLLDDVYIIS